MADLRTVVAGLGHTGVTTYVQSGNVLFSTERADASALAAELEAAIAAALPIKPRVVVVSCAELASVVRGNPYPQEANPRMLHAVFLPAPPPESMTAEVAAAQRAAAERGSRDTATFAGRVLYLHTPDGYGRSELAARLARGHGPLSPRESGTARNWGTVRKLAELCGG
jgi:uncharacterized protein (DUF1697 family)